MRSLAIEDVKAKEKTARSVAPISIVNSDWIVMSISSMRQFLNCSLPVLIVSIRTTKGVSALCVRFVVQLLESECMAGDTNYR